MIDIKIVRENPNIIIKDLKKRRDSEKISWIQDLIKKDKESNKIKQQIDLLRHKRNTLSKQINQLKKQDKNIKPLLKEVKNIPKNIKSLEDKYQTIQNKIKFYLMRLPNITHKTVPYGKDDTENKVIKKYGEIKKQKIRSHGELAEELNLINFKKAAEVSGAGFHYLKNDLAHLNLAIMQFAIDFLTKKGYNLIIPPLMLRKKAYEGVTDMEDFKNVMYKVENEDLYLIATSEHPLATLYMNENIKESQLPIKIIGVSPCFRKEIGSRGIDTKGLFRIHQFWKVEQFIFCKPEDSWKYHEELQKNSEEIYKKLKIPFRVVNVCTGDLGIVASKKYDVEAWFPRQKEYKEVGSNANCTDYQARRLNIKYMDKTNKRQFVHTLNNTALATSRTMVAILENYQKNNKIKIPIVLKKYMYNKMYLGE